MKVTDDNKDILMKTLSDTPPPKKVEEPPVNKEVQEQKKVIKSPKGDKGDVDVSNIKVEDGDDMASLFQKAMDKVEGGEEEEEEGTPPAEKSKDETDLDKKFPEIKIDDIPSASAAIKSKFKAFKDRESTMLTDLKERVTALTAKDTEINALKKALEEKGTAPVAVTESEEYKALLKERDSYKAVSQKIDLENDPEFKSSFDARINQALAGTPAIIKKITDEGQKNAFLRGLQIIAQMPPGEEGEADYIEAVDSLLEASGLSAPLKRAMEDKLNRMRPIMNERAERLKDVEATRNQMQQQNASNVEQSAKALISQFDEVDRSFETENAERLKMFRANPVFEFDETVNPLKEQLKKELAETVRGRALTPGALKFMHEGIVTPFLRKQLTSVLGWVNDLLEEKKVLEEKLGLKRAKKTTGNPPVNKAKDEADEETVESLMAKAEQGLLD